MCTARECPVRPWANVIFIFFCSNAEILRHHNNPKYLGAWGLSSIDPGLHPPDLKQNKHHEKRLYNSQQAKKYWTHIGPKWVFYMGPIWATHMGLMRDLQHGSMLDTPGQSHMGTIWVQYGKNQSTFIFQKKTFTHYKSPVPAHLMDWKGANRERPTYMCKLLHMRRIIFFYFYFFYLFIYFFFFFLFLLGKLSPLSG